MHSRLACNGDMKPENEIWPTDLESRGPGAATDARREPNLAEKNQGVIVWARLFKSMPPSPLMEMIRGANVVKRCFRGVCPRGGKGFCFRMSFTVKWKVNLDHDFATHKMLVQKLRANGFSVSTTQCRDALYRLTKSRFSNQPDLTQQSRHTSLSGDHECPSMASGPHPQLS